MSKPIWVKWCPKDALDGTMSLDPWAELAYRRLLDMIYSTGDNLPDDDRRMGWATKTGGRWPKIKRALIEAGKIEIIEGRITNARCRETLEEAARFFEQKSVAGKASAARRKSLKRKETGSTDVATHVAAHAPAPVEVPLLPEEPKPKPQAKAQDKRGTRLLIENLPDEWREWAIERGLRAPEREWEKFRDYWTARPGQGGVKLDWLATWRNWVRTALERNGGGRVTPLRPPSGRVGMAEPAPREDFAQTPEQSAALMKEIEEW